MKAVIMAGGRGTRFWPASREDYPKQFLEILGPGTMLQKTVDRLHPLLTLDDIFVACGEDYIPLVRSQLVDLPEDQIIEEPFPRGTAACVGLAAVCLRKRFGDEMMLVLPADHLIREVEGFHRALEAASEVAREGWLVTFGIAPSYPATGYGYIQAGGPLSAPGDPRALKVGRFTEKPGREDAESFLQDGRYLWNSGMFLWSVDRILEDLREFMPQLHLGLAEISRDNQAISRVFSELEAVSIDKGVLEKSDRVAVLPCQLGWNDVGNWRVLEETGERDENGITSIGDVVSAGSRNCIVHHSRGKLVALLGVEDLVVVETEDALLVCAKDRTEEVRELVRSIREKGLSRYL